MFIFKYNNSNMNTDDACTETSAPFSFCALNNVFDFKDTVAKIVSFIIIVLLNLIPVRITGPVVIKTAGTVQA